jgi:hypothetical protein
VTVEERAVNSGSASDPGRVDLLAFGGGSVKGREHALATPDGFSPSTFEHRLSSCVRSGALARFLCLGVGHAVTSVVGAGAAVTKVGMPRGTAWAAR